MLAKETDKAFNDKDWIFEIKWDGYRAIAEIEEGEVQLYSRNGLSFNSKYPIVANELKKIKHDAVLDGEIVILDEEGRSSFQKLQHYEENTQYPICYCVFDLLELNGQDICDQPLLERKKLLRALLRKNNVIKYSDHIAEKGIDFFNLTGKQGLEGIMGKDGKSLYQKGIGIGGER